MQIKQFKLSNGEEIVCEVVHWPTDEIEEVVVKKCLRISIFEDYRSNTRYYSFKPWLVFSDNPETLNTINPFHIVGETNPSEDLLVHFNETISSFEEQAPLKKWTKEEEDVFEKVLDKIKQEIDSEGSNVIQFKPKGTLH